MMIWIRHEGFHTFMWTMSRVTIECQGNAVNAGWIAGPLEPNKTAVIDNDVQLGQTPAVSLC